MNRRLTITGGTDPNAVVRQRCLALNLPTIAIDAEGRLLDTGDGGALDRWCRSRPITDRLAKAVAQWNQETHPAGVELLPGVWAVAAPETHRRRVVGYLVALMIGPAALSGPGFDAACAAAGLSAEEARAALAPLAQGGPNFVESCSRLLRWLRDDQASLRVSEESVSGFSRQLTESYEEINLLYKLGSAMNHIVKPDKFVRLACDELHATLRFRWVGAGFVDDRALAKSLAGKFVQSGANDPEAALIRSAIPEIVRTMRPGKERILSPNELWPMSLSEEGEIAAQPVARDGRIVGVILAGDKGGDDPRVSSVDLKLLGAAASYLGIHIQNAALYDEQQAMFLGTLKALTASIDAKDRYTRGHSERVALLTRQLAEASGMTGEALERVHIAGLVHDVGKIGVPEAVLRKPGSLTDAEFALIKMHPEIGFNILKDIPQLADVLPGVLHHHERWDGRGYPWRIAGENIPHVARLISLADSFDAMSSTRTYRPAMPRAKALDEIARSAGTQFDPALARIFCSLSFEEYDTLVARHMAQEGPAGIGEAA